VRLIHDGRITRRLVRQICQNKEPHCGSLRAGARKRQLAFSDAHQSHPRGAFCVIGNEVFYYRTKSRTAALCALVRASVSLHFQMRTSRILAERFV